jgi:uncharacterized protein YciI
MLSRLPHVKRASACNGGLSAAGVFSGQPLEEAIREQGILDVAMHFLLFYDVVDDYVERRGPFRAEHLSLIQKAHGRGELVMAGALADPPDGAVLVFRGPSAQSAESFANADPYVLNGLVKNWRVRAWNTVLGDGARFPAL